MTETKAQEQDKTKLRESVFAKEKTYGEKKYDFIFGNVINFWVNLLASGAFAFYVKHSVKPIFGENSKIKNLRDLQQAGSDKLHSMGMDKGKAESVVNVFTLLTPGHFVMIPSVWLGEKYKAKIVKHFNRKHYGEEAMQSDELRARHAQIESAEKPSLLGTVVARVETAFINMGIGYLIGAPDNLIKKAGAKGYNGIDASADKFGVSIGAGIEKASPKMYKKINDKLSHPDFDWSQAQRDAAKAGTGEYSMADVNGKYNRGFDNLIRYITQDIMYTLIAAGIVHPAVNFTKRFLPGMTYKQHLKHPTRAPEPVQPKSYHFDETPAEQAAAAPVQTIPTSSISHIQNESTLTPRDERAVGASV